jgi:hypothetical protein
MDRTLMIADDPVRSTGWLIAGAAILTGLAWMVVVPPFEGPDESAFYKDLMATARGAPARGLPLYALVMKPVLMLAGGQQRAFQAKYNPSFRFIGNQRGRVNMYMHGRSDGFARGDVNRLYLLRLLTVMLWAVTLVLIFHVARLFFGRSDLACLTAALVLALPGVSFFASKVHPEATTSLLASAAYLVIAARVFGRVSRTAWWIAAATIIALAPLSDRQAYFLVLLLPFALVAVETTWLARACAAAVLAVPAALGLAFIARRGLPGDLSTWIAPLLPSYRQGWWNTDTVPFLAFEFLPKQAFGFFGWLGQPSILLPAPVYAALIVAFGLGLWGLVGVTPAVPSTRDHVRFAWIGAAGVFLTIAPILYTNILIARTTTGRWLYPSMAPIMVAVVAGWRRVIEQARQRPRRLAAGLAVTAGTLGVLWATAPGDTMRAGIHANHYGDADHLIRTITYAVAVLVALAAAVEASRFIRWPRQLAAPEQGGVIRLAAVSWALNLMLLVTFVLPLYQPLDADDFTAAVRAEIADRDYGRASALYRIGVTAYPESAPLRRIETDEPMLVLTGGDDILLAGLRARIGRGEQLENREELTALARVVATKGWLELDMLEQVVRRADDKTELREPLAMIRAQADGRQRDGSAAADVVRAGGGSTVPLDMHGEATLEGYTLHAGSSGRMEVTVYFSPRRDWSHRHLWVHAYPAGASDYLVLEPSPPAFQGWKPRELAWETFPLPSNNRFTLYVGVELAGNLGPAFLLGAVGPGSR